MCKSHVFTTETVRGSRYFSPESGTAEDDIDVILVCDICGEPAEEEDSEDAALLFEDSIPY